MIPYVLVTKFPICEDRPAAMHKHLHSAHGWAESGSVFGRIIYHHDTGSFVCSGCGVKATKTARGLYSDGPITVEYNPRCGVCGLTFTTNKD